MVKIRMFLNWLVSATFRRARDMHKQVRKAINAQRDILTEKQLAAIREAKEELRQALRSGASKQRLQEVMAEVEEVANKNLHPYPHPSIRENVEVVLVAVAVAMAVRTFFLQPFKIPAGSMQPTLYGVTTDSLKGENDSEIPHGWKRFYESWVRGTSYYHVEARAPGRLNGIGAPRTIFPFVQKQTVRVGNEDYTIWFPPDTLNASRHASPGRPKPNPFLRYYGLDPNSYFQKGDEIIKMKVTSGDYLFVDRLSYNFRRPKRGEIIVFETKGIQGLNQNQFYIKRLIAKGGETVRIGNDRHVYIDGKKLTAETPGFEKLYSFDPSEPPRRDQYSGHVNGYIAAKYSRFGPGADIAKIFPNEHTTYTVGKDHYMAMGDNTMNSKDSRNWGDFDRKNVIGKFCFVYWPFSERWGP